MIDFDLLQDFDILLTSNSNVIGDLIRAGEILEYDREEGQNIFASVEDAVQAAVAHDVPSHALYVYDIDNLVAVEQTYPKAQLISLHAYENTDPKASGDHTVQVFRCPWLDAHHNSNCLELQKDLKNWAEVYVASGEEYSVNNLFSFLGVTKENYTHTVCSMFVTLGLLKNVVSKGYGCNFPSDWSVNIPNSNPPEQTVGLVSPWDLKCVLNKIGWSIPYKKVPHYAI